MTTVWHTVACPFGSGEYLSITTHWPDSVQDTVWETPRNRLDGKRTGFPGTIDPKTVSGYYVEVKVSQGGRTATMKLEELDYKKEESLPDTVWKIPPVSP